MRYGVGLAILAALIVLGLLSIWGTMRERQRKRRADQLGIRINIAPPDQE